jgi:hypothetical protein
MGESIMVGSGSKLGGGPVPQSDELRDLLRLRRALVKRMPERREELSPTGDEVSLTFLEEVEASSAVTLPYDVIALATLRIPAVVRAVGLRVEHLGGPVRDCAGDFGPPRGWVAVASFGREGMSTETELRLLGKDTLLAISKKATRDGDPEVRTLDGPGPSELGRLSTFIRERWKKRYARSERWVAAVEDARTDTTDDDECVVHIVDDRPPPPGPAMRVVHAKFGEGTVVREIEGGKLEIAFDSGVTKTLQKSFVREV